MPTQLEQLRANIVEFQEERAKIEKASVPREEALNLIERTIAHNASRSLVGYRVLLCPGESVASLDLVPNGHVAAALCSFFPDLIRSKLVAEVDRQLEEWPSGLPTAERPGAVAKLEAEIRELGVQEEALILEAEAAGIEIDRRGDADPRIVLSVVEEASSEPPKPQTKRPEVKKSKRSHPEWDGKSGVKPKQSTRPTRI
jgi:hypothetical protein